MSSLAPVDPADCSSGLGKCANMPWIFFLRFVLRSNPAFRGLLEFPDDGTIVFPDRSGFEAKMKEEYGGVRCAKWGVMVDSVRKAGYDAKKDREDKNRVTLTHILGFGAGETDETFVENLGKLRKRVDEIRKEQKQEKDAKRKATALARALVDASTDAIVGGGDQSGAHKRPRIAIEGAAGIGGAAASSAAVSASGGNGAATISPLPFFPTLAFPPHQTLAIFQAGIAAGMMQTILQQVQTQTPATVTPPLFSPAGSGGSSSNSSNGSSPLPLGLAPPLVPAMPLAENGAGLTQPTLQPHGSGTANGQPQPVQQQAGTGGYMYDGGNGGDGIGGGDGGIGGVFLGDDAAGTGANDPLLMMNDADGAGDGNAGDGGAGVNDLSAGPGLDDDGEWYDSQEAFASFLGDILPSDE